MTREQFYSRNSSSRCQLLSSRRKVQLSKGNKKGLCLTLREGGPASSVELQASLVLLVERHLLALLNT